MANKENEIKIVKGITPAGVAVYPRLTEPDTKFDADGVYSLKLKLTEDEAQPLIDAITAVADEAFAEAEAAAANPKAKAKLKRATPSFEAETNDAGEETGFYLFNFKMKASVTSKKTGKQWTRKPALFDAKLKPITDPSINIWGGSVVRIAYELMPYNSPSFGIGCSQRLNAVQIILLRNGGEKDAASFGFGEEEGFTITEQPAFGETAIDTEGADAEGDF